MVIFVFIFGGLLSLAGALTYAELSAAMPEANAKPRVPFSRAARQSSLETVVDQIGRADGAVVARCMAAVRVQPRVGLVLELVDGDHPDRP